MFDDLLFALRNFRRNKIRSILSLLGIIIGVASVIVITSLSAGATQSIKDSYASAGLDLVRVSAGFMQRGRNALVTFNDTFRENLFDAVSNIKTIQYINSVNTTLSRGDTTVSANATAIEQGYLEINGIQLASGSDFTVSNQVLGQQKMLIGSEIAEGLFEDENPVGQKVIVIIDNATFNFEIVGVLEESTGSSTNNAVFVPRGFYNKKIKPSATANSIIVQCVSQEVAATVADHIQQYITFVSGSEYAARVISMQAMLEQFEEVNGTVSLILSGIAAISLLVGGIGIMNIMIVTVTERRKEIGIRKALGATPSDIRNQFLVESATLTLTGGAIGIGVGIIISAAILYARKLPFAIQWEACLIAFGFSVFVGIFFGLNPALRAAKLDPVEALASD